MILRPYQRAAVDSIFDYWSKGGGNPLIDLATGTGKSVVIATLARELIRTMAGLPHPHVSPRQGTGPTECYGDVAHMATGSARHQFCRARATR